MSAEQGAQHPAWGGLAIPSPGPWQTWCCVTQPGFSLGRASSLLSNQLLSELGAEPPPAGRGGTNRVRLAMQGPRSGMQGWERNSLGEIFLPSWKYNFAAG